MFSPDVQVIRSNVLQVEFAPDLSGMTWASVKPAAGVGKAGVWYAPFNRVSGLPDLTQEVELDTLLTSGWPYWGRDNGGQSFVYRNQRGRVVRARVQTNGSIVRDTFQREFLTRSNLINVSRSSTTNQWLSFNTPGTTHDSLWVWNLNQPNQPRRLLGVEALGGGQSAYAATFPRWIEGTQILTYPYTAGSATVYFAMRWIDLATNQTRNITNDGPAAHLDDLAFTRGTDTLLFSSRNFIELSIQKLSPGGFFQEQYRQTPSTGLSTTGTYRLSSFEPTDWQGKTYGAFQIWQGTGLPGTTEGEIWLTDLAAPHPLVRLNGNNQVAVDPESVVGDTAVWVYYYGYTLGGPTVYNLYRAQTPLRQSVTANDRLFSNEDLRWQVYPTVASEVVHITHSEAATLPEQTSLTVVNAQGQILSNQQIVEAKTAIDTRSWSSGLYLVNISWLGGSYNCRLVKP